MWWTTLSLQAAMAGDCTTPANTSTLAGALDDAEAAYSALDLEAFDAAMGRLREQLLCTEDVVSSALAASVHRMEGLDAFVSSAPSRATSAFAAARSIEPDYRFPPSMVPEGNPVLVDYKALDPAAGGLLEIAEPRGGSLRLDGRNTLERRKVLPVVFQRLDKGGAVADTAYLWPEDPLPSYDVASQGISGRQAARIGLFAGAGAAAIGSGVMYALAGKSAGAFETAPYAELDGLRSQTNGRVLASGGLAALALGAGVGGILVGSF
jgi:hypothetical protein